MMLRALLVVLLAACTTPLDTQPTPTRVEVSWHRDCYPLSVETVRAELDAVTPGGIEALWPGVTVSLWPGRAATSVPEGSWIIVDCDLSGLAEEAAKLIAWREGKR